METDNNLSARDFIQRVLIEETGNLVKNKSFHFAFLVMVQGIETLGSFLDNKPLKAKDQSKLRFSHAINRLMPHEYSKLNNNHSLYDKLRASLAHTLTTSRQIFLTSKDNSAFGNKHLQEINGKLILVCEDFYTAYKKACIRLLEAMEKDIVSEKKKIAEFYYTFL